MRVLRILMLVATSVATDSRVLKEATTLVAAGHDVHVIGRQVPDGWTPPAGVRVSSVGAGSLLRPEGSTPSRGRLPVHLRAVRWLLLPEHRNQTMRRWSAGVHELARHEKADVVHAHDFSALGVGHRLAGELGVPLVYDSHEFWAGRTLVGRPTPLQRWRERRVEARLGAAATAVITVGQGVADALRQTYGWKHVVVVRNSFPYIEPPPAEPAPRGAVYAGRLGPHRDLEAVARASGSTDLPITLVGPADETWLAAFDPERAEVLPALTIEDVDRLLQQAGLSLVTLEDRGRNHRLALPNKLFHAVRAGVPVVATDVGELARTVRTHGIGTLYRAGDAGSLVAALAEAVRRYPELAAATRAAARGLSWESDAAVVTGVYERLAHGQVATA